MQKAYNLIFFFTTFFSLGFANFETENPSFFLPHELTKTPGLIINNRPLAKINGKVISLYDLVKKMDLFLFEYYPQLSLSPIEKYHFYINRWEITLDDMVNDELVLLDAEQKEIKISDGEVREELEARFGPNTMSNLYKINYEYEEARELIRQELSVQRLIGMKVHSKAVQATTPEVIKKNYEIYLEENPPEEEWKYQVLSIRGKDKGQCKEVAEKAYNLLEKEGQPIEKLSSMLEEEGVTVNLSDDYSGGSKKLSKIHFDVVQTLSPNSYSPPVLQISRFDNSTVMRIFYLKEFTKNVPQAFDQIYDQLKNKILIETFEKEKASYVNALKKRFGYQNHDSKFELPKDYQPFALL